MTLDTTLAEYIYDHIKRCLGGSEERGGLNEKKNNKRGRNRKEEGGRGEELIRER